MDILHHIFAFDQQSPLLFTQFYFWAFFAIVYSFFALIVSKNGSTKKRMHLRNVYLMFVSWFFYYKTSGIFLLILLFVTLSDWLIAKQVYRTKSKWWLCLSVMIDLGILAYFKYAYFGVDVANTLLGTELSIVDQIILPVGISFYIFQVISYTVDVYRGHIKPVDNLLDFGFYVSFFPQLVAGPIVRATEFIPQLYKPFFLTRRQFGIAVFWILNGLIKKIVLSDYLAVNFIDRIFDNPLLFSGFENLMALFVYSMQVYADFSGYTDIAIGVAMVMGFYLPQNFNSPYKAQNPQQFWRRWHISLSRWLKSYLYIPLGGNRQTTKGTWIWIALFTVIGTWLSGSYWVAVGVITLASIIALVAWRATQQRRLLYSNLNSFITMLLGGLWHGASWNFIIWGGLNGIGMIVNKIWREMHWRWQVLVLVVVVGGMWALQQYTPAPVWNVFAIWITITFVGYLIFDIWGYCPLIKRNNALYKLQSTLSGAWAVVQTFVFISFTRLFFRASSNLDPAFANEEAWETAKNMMGQIGGAWNSSIIADVLWEYRTVMLLFAFGMLIHWLPSRWKRWYRLNFAMLPLWVMVQIVVATVFIVYQFITADMQPFIYFQF